MLGSAWTSSQSPSSMVASGDDGVNALRFGRRLLVRGVLFDGSGVAGMGLGLSLRWGGLVGVLGGGSE